MSAGTIILAYRQIMTDEFGDVFPQIQDIDAVPIIKGFPSLFPQNTPAIIFEDSPAKPTLEQSASFGRNKVDYDIDMHVFWAVGIPPTPETAATFKDYVALVTTQIRRHGKLDGLANVAGESAVLLAGRRIVTKFMPPMLPPRDASHVWYHCLITSRVQEYVRVAV